MTFVEAGVRADLRGDGKYFSFRDGISPRTPFSGTWKRLHGFENVTRSLNPQGGETFDQQAAAERLLLQEAAAGSALVVG